MSATERCPLLCLVAFLKLMADLKDHNLLIKSFASYWIKLVKYYVQSGQSVVHLSARDPGQTISDTSRTFWYDGYTIIQIKTTWLGVKHGA